MSEQHTAVLFDLDGTLINTYQLIVASFRHATKQVLGHTLPDEQLMAKVGQPLTVQMWDFTTSQETHDELLEVYRTHNHAVHDKMVSSFPGISNALRELQNQNIALGVVTSKLHALAKRGLECTGLLPFMQVIVSPDTYPNAYKPAPGPVLHGCEMLGVEPQQCWYVGDSPFDIEAGNAAGCRTAAVLWGMFSEHDLRAQNPTVVCKTPENLVRQLGL